MEKENRKKLQRIDLIFLGIILVVAFAFRCYKLTIPLADFHSWRQSDTAAVSRNYVKGGIDLLHPRYDDLSNIQSGKENPQGYRYVEFPLYNAFMAMADKTFPFITLEVWGRIISIISSLVVLAIVYYFLYKEYSRTAAVMGSILFATFPFFVFFSRVVLPEMNALAFSFLAMLFLYKFTFDDHKNKQKPWIFFSLSIVSFICALLIKPTTIFYALPLVLLFFYRNHTFFARLPFYIYFFISFLPLIAWRQFIQQYPEGIPGNTWLITAVNTPTGLQPIFLKPAFFRWVFYERISNLILGAYTTFLFLIGLLVKSKRYFLHSIVVAAAMYLFVFEGGNVQHVYYQTLILPAVAICVGLGAAFLIENAQLFISKIGVYLLILVCFVFSFLMSYYQVKDYYNYSDDLVNIARYIKLTTNPDDKIVTDTVGDTTLLYLSDRRGAPAVFKSLPELKADGYTYFVTMSKDVADKVKKETSFQVVGENDKFTLFRL